MNCDECMEQVLELIEREEIDPEGVRAVLERCPECRASFEQTKAALARAGELPIEEPPIAADAAILRVARKRSERGTPARPRWLGRPEWAVAAAALLAVGIGVWAVPRDENTEQAEQPPGTGLEKNAIAAKEPKRGASRLQMADDGKNRGANAAAAVQERALRARSQRRGARAAPESAAPRPAEDVDGAPVGQESAASVSALAGASGAAESTSLEDAPRISPECQRRLAKVEKAEADRDAPDMDPEEVLAIGRCYQELGEVREARRWLRRAALHPKTQKRAERAIGRLPSE